MSQSIHIHLASSANHHLLMRPRPRLSKPYLLKKFSIKAKVTTGEHFKKTLSGSGCNSLHMLRHATSAKCINLKDEAWLGHKFTCKIVHWSALIRGSFTVKYLLRRLWHSTHDLLFSKQQSSSYYRMRYGTSRPKQRIRLNGLKIKTKNKTLKTLVLRRLKTKTQLSRTPSLTFILCYATHQRHMILHNW